MMEGRGKVHAWRGLGGQWGWGGEGVAAARILCCMCGYLRRSDFTETVSLFLSAGY